MNYVKKVWSGISNSGRPITVTCKCDYICKALGRSSRNEIVMNEMNLVANYVKFWYLFLNNYVHHAHHIPTIY